MEHAHHATYCGTNYKIIISETSSVNHLKIVSLPERCRPTRVRVGQLWTPVTYCRCNMFGGRHGTCTRIPVRDVRVTRRLGERDEPCRYSTMTWRRRTFKTRSRDLKILYSTYIRICNCNGDRLRVSVSPPTSNVGLLISSCARRSKVSGISRG